MTKRRFWTPATIAVAFVVAIFTYQVFVPWGVSWEAKRYLGSRTATIIVGATRVESYRINGHQRVERGDSVIDGYPITATGQEQGHQFASALARVVLNEHLFTDDKTCIFAPGVAFRLWKGNESVWVLVCYNCNELMVFSGDVWGRRLDKSGIHEDFDIARPALVKLAKEAFPNDKVIQRLQEESGNFSESI